MSNDERVGRIKAQIEETVEELEDLADDLDELVDDDSDDEDDDDQDDEDDEDDEDEDPPAGGDGTRPDEVLDLRLWTVMLPEMKPDGDTPRNDYAKKWGADYPTWFFVRNGAVVFRTPANGDHSKNSNYARTEAREMVDTDWTEAAWSSKGPRSLTCDMAIDASGLTRRKRINGMQIHDGGDDVCQVMRHETNGLGLMHSDGKKWEPIDPGYKDGQRFTCTLSVEGDRIRVDYNGRRVVDIAKKGSSWYFKWGCYLQSGGASEFEEPAGAYGEVVVWDYAVTGGAS
jgi:hypothetical protein